MPACTLYACLVKFGGHNLNGFTQNLTGQIWGKSIEIDAGRFGCKFIEITLHAWSKLVDIISMDLLPIRPGIKYWSNWVEIHWQAYNVISSEEFPVKNFQ